jgi:hypothetical protein
MAGDSEGAKLITIMIVANALAARSRSQTSRTIARPSTIPAQPPIAASVWPTISTGSDQANPQSTVPRRNSVSPARSNSGAMKRPPAHLPRYALYQMAARKPCAGIWTAIPTQLPVSIWPRACARREFPSNDCRATKSREI